MKRNQTPTNSRFREIRITPEGWIFIVILGFISVGAVLRNVNLLILMAGLMIGSLLINWRMGMLWLKTLKARRILPHRVYANQLSSVQWICQNEATITAWNVEIRDNLQSAPKISNGSLVSEPKRESEGQPTKFTANRLASIEFWLWLVARFFGFRTGMLQNMNVKVSLLQVAANRSEVVSYRLLCQQRGRYAVGPGLLSTKFPFGLISSRLLIPEREFLCVAPAIGKLTAAWDQHMRSSVVGSDAVKRKRSLDADEFYGLRPWRSGDTKKHIHWRTSAKFGQPIVKQHEQPDNRDFAMLLDLYSPDSEGGQSSSGTFDPGCETILSFAATVLLQLGKAVHGNIAIGICGRENIVCRSRNHRELVDRAMQQLAMACPASEQRLTDTLLEISQMVSASTPLYVISTRSHAAEFEARDSDQGLPSKETSVNSWSGKLAAIGPLVRWITVDSAEFGEMFSLPAKCTDESVHTLTKKWEAVDVTS